MKHKKIKYTPTFLKQLRNLPKSQLSYLYKKQQILTTDPLDQRLKTHKLKGGLAKFYAFTISYHWRVVFHYEDKETIVFDKIGTHEIYR